MYEDIIKKYFHENYTQEEMKALLYQQDGKRMSISTIKRILHSMGLKRKNIVESNINEICFAVVEELFSSGYNLGYRSLWQKLKIKYNLTVKRSTVYYVLRIADPDGVASRFANKLRRRQYLSPGPNFVWHLDGYDKLKPFGFAVHACMDGFSRKIIWLEVATTNNDPKVIAYYYLKEVKSLEVLPTIIRSDKGSENSLIEVLHMCLRSHHEDKFAGPKSFIKGKSTRNQRIESFWGRLRQHTADFYIQFFKCMQEKGLIDGSTLHIKCLQYCFGPLIKSDLNYAKILWNKHFIRKQPVRNNLFGRPNVMYNLPNKYGAVDYKKEVSAVKVQRLIDRFTTKPVLFDKCIQDIAEMYEGSVPKSPKEALQLYKELLKLISFYKVNS